MSHKDSADIKKSSQLMHLSSKNEIENLHVKAIYEQQKLEAHKQPTTSLLMQHRVMLQHSSSIYDSNFGTLLEL